MGLVRPPNLHLRNNRTMNRVKANSNRRLPNNTQLYDGQFTLHISAFGMKNEDEQTFSFCFESEPFS